MINFNDGYINFITGAGERGKDKNLYTHYKNDDITEIDAISIYDQSWSGSRLVKIPINDMIRKWRFFEGQRKKRWEALDVEFCIKKISKTALTYAKVTGGAAIYFETEDKDLNLPIDGRSKLKRLHVFHRGEINTSFYGHTHNSLFRNDLDTVTITRSDVDSTLPVHVSRFVFINGPDVTFHDPAETVRVFQGKSCYAATKTLINTFDGLIADLSHLSSEMGLDIIQIPDLATHFVNEDAERQFTKRMTAAQLGKSVRNALVIDKDETHDTKILNLEPYSKLMRSLLEALAAAGNMPLTKFLGVSPGGMNATGESDTRFYYDTIAEMRKVWLGGSLNRIDQKIEFFTGVKRSPYVFPQLWEKDDKEDSEITNNKVSSIIDLQDTNLYSDQEMRKIADAYLCDLIEPALSEE